MESKVIGKAEEIKLFKKFIDSLPEDSYFKELRDAYVHMVRNIEADWPAILGIFVPAQEYHDKVDELHKKLQDADGRIAMWKSNSERHEADAIILRSDKEQLYDRIRELQEHDVRTIVARKRALEQKRDEAQLEIDLLELQLNPQGEV